MLHFVPGDVSYYVLFLERAHVTFCSWRGLMLHFVPGEGTCYVFVPGEGSCYILFLERARVTFCS